ncbi:DUF402 domain-containing protein [[Mycoplasma] gypis]|uniref:DUF402 domain-containing protein n=1 Tax=[Mycoplasma] gypis TaxID=92404 RepID=A0ABZ2RPS1_9BACT|nr:DUF402 domain-containing protein [[Mycoplasma] gypis]MBN0919085.1 DUF402 domain-containing protein [[Mycoplasma] gypis]
MNNNVKKNKNHFLSRGKFLEIQCYKYDGHLYRQYDGVKIIENNKDYLVTLMLKTKVSEENINWVVAEPTLFIFSKHHFFNATVLIRNNQKYVYVNLASPFFIEKNVIKYIDFDLDIKTHLDHDFNVIDWPDFKQNIQNLNYSKELIYKIYNELDYLFLLFNSKKEIFDEDFLDSYVDLIKNQKDII